MTDIQTVRNKISPIAEKYGVEKVYLFGSRARGDDKADSDYDFLISSGGLDTLLLFSGFCMDLEEAFQASVDVISDGSFDEDLISEARREGVPADEQQG